MKYNSNDKYERLKREYKTISEIKNKTWNDEFKEKTRCLYYEFRKYGFEVSAHNPSRIVERVNSKKISKQEILSTLTEAINYTGNEKNIRYY